MSRFHFLNVKNGDCSIIEHNTGSVSMIDVCNARLPRNEQALSPEAEQRLIAESRELAEATGAKVNYGQKANPENPLHYMERMRISDIFRLAITHPDMDHMDGLVDLFERFCPTNYYDTNNNKKITEGWENSPYREEDWKFYKKLRDNPPTSSPKRIALYPKGLGPYRTEDWKGNRPGDAFYTLAPSKELVEEANGTGDYNDASYVFLWRSIGGRVLMSGDSHDKTWDYILSEYPSEVEDVELLIAPHHGRRSGRSYKFLDVVKPKMTFFGNAPSKELAYHAWRDRGLPYITNNMAGSMIVDCSDGMALYVTNERYARDQNAQTFYSELNGGWFIRRITS